MSGSMSWRRASGGARWRILPRTLDSRARRLPVRLDLAFLQIGVLVPVVFFLLEFFSASGEPAIRRAMDLPGASNVVDPVPAPVVSLNRQLILVNEHPVGSSQAIEDAGQVTPCVRELRSALETLALDARKAGGASSPGLVLIEANQDVPAVVLLSVVGTAALAGYPHLGFLVHRRGPWR